MLLISLKICLLYPLQTVPAETVLSLNLSTISVALSVSSSAVCVVLEIVSIWLDKRNRKKN